MSTYAPIVLFVYKRPSHTLKTLESLNKNILSDQSSLYIYSDGAHVDKFENTTEEVAEVRKIIRQKQWCKNVTIIEREKNIGLANNIVSGVTDIVRKFGQVIVLEDDIVTSTGFLTYMNNALNLYKNNTEVMHVSAYLSPIDTSDIEQHTFFYSQTSCWGWGTWDNAWQKLNTDADFLLQKIKKTQRVSEFNIEDSYPFADHLKANIEGRINTWAIKWQASVFLENGKCLHPKKSLTRNIGFDNSGEHCVYSEIHLQQKIALNIPVKVIPVEEFTCIRQKIALFNQRQSQPDPLIYRIKNKIVRRIRNCFLKS